MLPCSHVSLWPRTAAAATVWGAVTFVTSFISILAFREIRVPKLVLSSPFVDFLIYCNRKQNSLCTNDTTIRRPNTLKWLARFAVPHLIRPEKITSNFCCNSGYPDSFRGFLQCMQKNIRTYVTLASFYSLLNSLNLKSNSSLFFRKLPPPPQYFKDGSSGTSRISKTVFQGSGLNVLRYLCYITNILKSILLLT